MITLLEVDDKFIIVVNVEGVELLSVDFQFLGVVTYAASFSHIEQPDPTAAYAQLRKIEPDTYIIIISYIISILYQAKSTVLVMS